SQPLASLLTPLKDDIEKFRNDVNQAYSSEARERFSLQERIKELIEANNSIGREAKELATALRGNSKTQGDWGELVLETILENSGLRRGSEFTIQQTTDSSGSTLRDEQGRGLRPDVVVHYPDGRAIIIDSKVSLTAFVDYVNTDDPQRRDHFGRLHLASVVKHINELADKNYQDHVGTRRLDFVMMFIPNESAYAAAMTLDPTLWTKAYDKRVLIVSPTQLVGSLRLINQLWSHDRQTRNAIEIAEKSGQMYDKFCGFVADMERIDKALTTTRAAYDSAIAKLRTGRGNLITRAETLRTLGVKASKRLKADMADSDEDASEE
ncbi:MAG: DNA recombination protein RmuC, partial [Paramuribaculum sp.]|nr:DNA recombination protein RmuC [Paramuribaculum sp.]